MLLVIFNLTKKNQVYSILIKQNIMKNKNLFTMMLLSIIIFTSCSVETENSNKSSNDSVKVSPVMQKMFDSTQTVTKNRADSSLTSKKNLIKKNLIKKNANR